MNKKKLTSAIVALSLLTSVSFATSASATTDPSVLPDSTDTAFFSLCDFFPGHCRGIDEECGADDKHEQICPDSASITTREKQDEFI